MQDFRQLEKVLRREVPDRPVLFEFFLNERLYKRALGSKYSTATALDTVNSMAGAFCYYGYDYATVRGSEYWFHTNARHSKQAESISLNEGGIITDRASFDKYRWMEPAECDYTALDDCSLASGQKLCVMGPGGVLENAISLAGFDNLCMMLYDDAQLVYDIFEKIGGGLAEYYRICAGRKNVGALISNDDWGFKTQTMLSPADMGKYVFPWHKKIVEAAHSCGKPVILHSCGNYSGVFDVMISLGYDARHSYEDNIAPVEKAYPQLRRHMAVLGGIDVDWLIKSPEEAIRERANNLLREGMKYGGYALGSGNSIPLYVPDEKYLAMIGAAQNNVKR